MAGRKSTLNDAAKARLEEAYSRLGSYSAAAREVGCSEQAARRYFGGISKSAEMEKPAARRSIVLGPAQRKPTSVSPQEIKTSLEEGYAELQAIAEQLHTQISVGGELNPLLVSAHTGVRREMRSYAVAYTNLLNSLTRAEHQTAFQQTTLDAIGRADEPTKARILAELKSLRAAGLLDLRFGASEAGG